jgi:hypothetical protein
VTIILQPGQRVLVSTGIALVAFPVRHEGILTSNGLVAKHEKEKGTVVINMDY